MTPPTRYVIATLVLSAGLSLASLLPDRTNNPCETPSGQMIPGCLSDTEVDERRTLRVTIAATSIAGAALVVIAFQDRLRYGKETRGT